VRKNLSRIHANCRKRACSRFRGEDRPSLDPARDPDPFDSAQGHPEHLERMSLSNGRAGFLHRSPNGIVSTSEHRDFWIETAKRRSRLVAILCVEAGSRSRLRGAEASNAESTDGEEITANDQFQSGQFLRHQILADTAVRPPLSAAIREIHDKNGSGTKASEFNRGLHGWRGCSGIAGRRPAPLPYSPSFAAVM
jgi:hypothetical protein